VQFLFVRCEGSQWPHLPGEFRGLPVFAFRLRPQALRACSAAESVPLQPCVLLSGLARPQAFERDAESFGLRPLASLRLSDHAQLAERERGLLAEFVRTHRPASVVLPAKNSQRFGPCLRELGLGVYVLEARIEWHEDPLPAIRRALDL
jgi:tetraacyldisaccharide-1-P 4'-kinase